MGQQFSLDDPPEKNIKDGVYTIIGGAVVAGLDFILELFGQYWEISGIPIYIFGSIIAGVGVVMAGIGLFRKIKNKNSDSDPD